MRRVRLRLASRERRSRSWRADNELPIYLCRPLPCNRDAAVCVLGAVNDRGCRDLYLRMHPLQREVAGREAALRAPAATSYRHVQFLDDLTAPTSVSRVGAVLESAFRWERTRSQ